jgi:hypothetical protein
LTIGIDEGRSVEAIVAGPSDLEGGVGFLKGDGFRIAVAGEACGDVVGGIEEPSIACLGREEDKLVGGDKRVRRERLPVAGCSESRRRVETDGGCACIPSN